MSRIPRESEIKIDIQSIIDYILSDKLILIHQFDSLTLFFYVTNTDNLPNFLSLENKTLKVYCSSTFDIFVKNIYNDNLGKLNLDGFSITNLEFFTIVNNRLNLNTNLEFIQKTLPIQRKELSLRLEEFEVIKSDKTIDLISLNSLYDFYNITFNQNDFS